MAERSRVSICSRQQTGAGQRQLLCGRYRVTLKFEEPSAREAGAREFNVLVNGKIILRRFDIFSAAGGSLKGIDRAFDLTSRDDTLLIEFVPLKGAALVSALSIESADRL